MKLVTYSDKKRQENTHAGILWGNWILDAQDIGKIATSLQVKVPPTIRKLSKTPTLLELLARGPRPLDDLRNLSWRVFNRSELGNKRFLKSVESVKLHAPIPKPPTLRDFYSFEDHVKTARAKRGQEIPSEWYEFPAFYYSNPTVVYGPDDDVPAPSYTKMLDFELEVAAVVGKPGKNIPEAEAEAYILGYTIMNDWSARDVQAKEMKIGLGPAKAKDFATSLGPWLVTADELEDRRAGPGLFHLKMMARVNGKPLSQGNMDKMHWSFPQMIARASQSVQLNPGEVFGSGTVGSGSILELREVKQKWLQPGDVVELEIERLGVLRNRIIAEKNG